MDSFCESDQGNLRRCCRNLFDEVQSSAARVWSDDFEVQHTGDQKTGTLGARVIINQDALYGLRMIQAQLTPHPHSLVHQEEPRDNIAALTACKMGHLECAKGRPQERRVISSCRYSPSGDYGTAVLLAQAHAPTQWNPGVPLNGHCCERRSIDRAMLRKATRNAVCEER